MGRGARGMGTTSAACSKSVIACRNPAACNREAALYQALSLASGRTTMLDSGMSATLAAQACPSPDSGNRDTLPIMNGRSAPRMASMLAILAIVVGGAGAVVMLFLNAFVFDDFDGYGEV